MCGESFAQRLSDDCRRAAFEIAAFEHLNKLSFLQNADRR
jgi:hypothetical protein